ncbi:unnamed protein product [Linum trigynum]|uniref:Uncharacterized protein n=1 Tax=Linum trigynum TaxID=586398 RepID=A0AAV2E7J5_9ROSI
MGSSTCSASSKGIGEDADPEEEDEDDVAEVVGECDEVEDTSSAEEETNECVLGEESEAAERGESWPWSSSPGSFGGSADTFSISRGQVSAKKSSSEPVG